MKRTKAILRNLKMRLVQCYIRMSHNHNFKMQETQFYLSTYRRKGAKDIEI